MPKRIKRECANYDELASKMIKYDAVNPYWVTIKKIVVATEKDKEQLLLAIKYLHNNFTIDTDFMAVNTLTHMYLNPDKIVVEDA